MKDHTFSQLTEQIIEEIVQGCSENQSLYQRYLSRTSWRVNGDFRFLKEQLSGVNSVLDIGGVPPLLTGYLAETGIKQIAVLDANVDIFKSYFDSKGITYYPGNIMSANVKPLNKQFELVCLCEVIEHLSGDLLKNLEKVTNCIADNGYFYVTTPNIRSISGAVAIFIHKSGLASKAKETVRAQYQRAGSEYGYYGHLREYTEKEIIDLIESFGFTHIKSAFQVRPRTYTKLDQLVKLLEQIFPKFRLFGKYLFKKL